MPVPKESVASTSKPKTAPKLSTQAMVDYALKSLNDRSGTSFVAIKKFIASYYNIDVEKSSHLIKRYIKDGLANGRLIQAKGKGAAGSVKLSPLVQKELKQKPKDGKSKNDKTIKIKPQLPKKPKIVDQEDDGPKKKAPLKKKSTEVGKVTAAKKVVKAKTISDKNELTKKNKTPTKNDAKLIKTPTKAKGGPEIKKASAKKAEEGQKKTPVKRKQNESEPSDHKIKEKKVKKTDHLTTLQEQPKNKVKKPVESDVSLSDKEFSDEASEEDVDESASDFESSGDEREQVKPVKKIPKIRKSIATLAKSARPGKFTKK